MRVVGNVRSIHDEGLVRPDVMTWLAEQAARDAEDSALMGQTLCREQVAALSHILDGHNVALLGPAGTGKSVVIGAAVAALRDAYAPRAGDGDSGVAVTATTGAAAWNVRGQTVHRFTGVHRGIPRDGDDYAYDRSLARAITDCVRYGAAKRLRDTRVLIVDEVSMLDPEHLDAIDAVARRVRECMDKPFGGIQVVFCGDFAQLQPVYTRTEEARRKKARSVHFAFQSDAWAGAGLRVSYLSRIFRQRDDEFRALLLDLRLGRRVYESVKRINEIAARGPLVDATHLYPRRAQADAHNDAELGKLGGEAHVFRAHDVVGASAATLLDSCPVAPTLTLRVGALVIYRRNTDVARGLMNGARGRVVGFAPYTGDELHVPLYAGSGTVKVAVADVAPQRAFPLVHFAHAKLTVAVLPLAFEAGDAHSRAGRAVRVQLPLMLGWATTVHYSQGATLEAAEMDLEGTFAPAMAYVALSRVRDPSGLLLLSPLSVYSISVNQTVINYYNELERTG